MATTFRLKRKLYAWPAIAAAAARALPKVASIGSKVIKGANAAGTAMQAGGAVKDGAKSLLGTPNVE